MKLYIFEDKDTKYETEETDATQVKDTIWDREDHIPDLVKIAAATVDDDEDDEDDEDVLPDLYRFEFSDSKGRDVYRNDSGELFVDENFSIAELLSSFYDGKQNFKRKSESLWPLLCTIIDENPSHRNAKRIVRELGGNMLFPPHALRELGGKNVHAEEKAEENYY